MAYGGQLKLKGTVSGYYGHGYTQSQTGNVYRRQESGQGHADGTARIRNGAEHQQNNAAHMRNSAEHRQNVPQSPNTSAKPRYDYDYSLLAAVFFMFILGLLIIYSSSQYTAALERDDPSYYFMRQLVIGSVGFVAAICISLFDYRKWLKGFGSLAVYGCSVVLLMMTLVMGLASHGKTRWISIAGVSFQPAEMAKIGLILFLSTLISVYGPSMRKRNHMLFAIAVTAVPTVLILNQNISSAVIVAMIAAVMIFVAVDRVKEFVLLGGLGLVFILGLKPAIRWALSYTGYTSRPEKYYLRRILAWAAPEIYETDAYQTMQGLYAIGSGGITGHGLGESIQKFGKIPEVQNDMIFAIICEEFGFIGAATLIIMFIYIIYRIYEIAINADDLFGTMICTGVMAHLGLQVVLNIAVVTGVIPNTGVTLPFISYGGSAILFTMAEMGLVLSVAHKIKRRD